MYTTDWSHSSRRGKVRSSEWANATRARWSKVMYREARTALVVQLRVEGWMVVRRGESEDVKVGDVMPPDR